MSELRHILAIEISNPGAGGRAIGVGRFSGPSVAIGRLNDDGGVELLLEEMLRSVTSDTGRSGGHDDDLLPAIERLCTQAGVPRRSIARVAVSVGPGGYTSVRIACAVGKMIAMANSGECVSVPTALGVAQALPSELRELPVAIVLASKGETCFVQVVQRGTPIGDGGIVGAEAILQLAAKGVRHLVADRHLSSALRQSAIGCGMSVYEPVFSAASVLVASAGLPVCPPDDLLPVYPREPEAVSLWNAKKIPR